MLVDNIFFSLYIFCDFLYTIGTYKKYVSIAAHLAQAPQCGCGPPKNNKIYTYKSYRVCATTSSVYGTLYNLMYLYTVQDVML